IPTHQLFTKISPDKLSYRTHFLKPPQTHSDAFFILAAYRHTLHVLTSPQSDCDALKAIY
ncbi:hypothetical protein, partial [Escherichia coli]|uniref:hypothetical protein n=1 Tax=Escherichia coli TaxID=562 RepID=UPI001BC85810